MVNDRVLYMQYLRANEGYRRHAYRCSAGKWTIGIGRNIDAGGPGIDEVEALYLLDRDISESLLDLQRILPDFDLYSQGRRLALMDMRFQLGPTGFRTFKRMLECVCRRDWAGAAREALDSKYAREDTPERAQQTARLLRTGRI
jgi:lysozyme